VLNVKKCMCWYSSIIELKNARWNIETHFPYELFRIANITVTMMTSNILLYATKTVSTCCHKAAPALQYTSIHFCCNSHITKYVFGVYSYVTFTTAAIYDREHLMVPSVFPVWHVCAFWRTNSALTSMGRGPSELQFVSVLILTLLSICLHTFRA